VGKELEKYRVRTRDGYRLQEQVPTTTQAADGEAAAADPQ
jgi:hypothetical protein